MTRRPRALTPRAQILFSRAASEARETGTGAIWPEHLLLAMARDYDSTASMLLRQCGVCMG